jgi:hypothetical protein
MHHRELGLSGGGAVHSKRPLAAPDAAATAAIVWLRRQDPAARRRCVYCRKPVLASTGAASLQKTSKKLAIF